MDVVVQSKMAPLGTLKTCSFGKLSRQMSVNITYTVRSLCSYFSCKQYSLIDWEIHLCTIPTRPAASVFHPPPPTNFLPRSLTAYLHPHNPSYKLCSNPPHPTQSLVIFTRWLLLKYLEYFYVTWKNKLLNKVRILRKVLDLLWNVNIINKHTDEIPNDIEPMVTRW